MNNVRAVFSLSGIHFRKWGSSYRILVIFVLLILTLYNALTGIRSLCTDIDIPVSPWSLMAITSTYFTYIILLMGYVFLYCDAPFLDEQQPYVILRCGRKMFCKAQILYIALSSLIYTFFVFGVTLLFTLPNISFSTQWGKVLNTLALTNLNSKYANILEMSDTILQMPALEAFAKQILLLWLTGCFIGLLIFVLNLKFSRVVGISCAAILVFMNMFASMFSISHGQFGGVIYWFLPTAWANLGILQSRASDPLPPFAYAVGMLIFLNALFSIIIYKMFKKKEIEVLPQI